jgi:hypothetical protein
LGGMVVGDAGACEPFVAVAHCVAAVAEGI